MSASREMNNIIEIGYLRSSTLRQHETLKPGSHMLILHTKDSLQTGVTSIFVVRIIVPCFLLKRTAMRHSEHRSRSDWRSNLCRLSSVGLKIANVLDELYWPD